MASIMFYRSLTSVPLAIGTVATVWLAYQIASFLYIHFIHSSGLSRYAPGEERPWALVTGSSDGIGKGFAEELCQRGFNVAIHGRNRSKLDGVAKDLKKQWPEASIRIAVLDAYPTTEEALDQMIASINDLPITVLINNVGGSGPISPIFRQLSALSYEDIATLIGINLDFPVALTAKLLPMFRARQPTLIMNVGSFVSAKDLRPL